MEINPDNIEDAKRYYDKTYVKFREQGDILYYINTIRQTEDKGEIYFKDKDNKEGILYVSKEYPYNIDFILPHKSMYQLGKYCYCLSRTPAKQFHRGISQNNCSIKALSGGDGWQTMGLDFKILEGFVNKPTFKSLQDAVVSKNVSEALSPRFAYNLYNHTLWCDWKSIGKIDKKLGLITVNPLLELEIKRLLIDTNMTNYFKVNS